MYVNLSPGIRGILAGFWLLLTFVLPVPALAQGGKHAQASVTTHILFVHTDESFLVTLSSTERKALKAAQPYETTLALLANEDLSLCISPSAFQVTLSDSLVIRKYKNRPLMITDVNALGPGFSEGRCRQIDRNELPAVLSSHTGLDAEPQALAVKDTLEANSSWSLAPPFWLLAPASRPESLSGGGSFFPFDSFQGKRAWPGLPSGSQPGIGIIPASIYQLSYLDESPPVLRLSVIFYGQAGQWQRFVFSLDQTQLRLLLGQDSELVSVSQLLPWLNEQLSGRAGLVDRMITMQDILDALSDEGWGQAGEWFKIRDGLRKQLDEILNSSVQGFDYGLELHFFSRQSMLMNRSVPVDGTPGHQGNTESGSSGSEDTQEGHGTQGGLAGNKRKHSRQGLYSVNDKRRKDSPGSMTICDACRFRVAIPDRHFCEYCLKEVSMEFMDDSDADMEIQSLCLQINQILEDIVNQRQYHDEDHIDTLLARLQARTAQETSPGGQADDSLYVFLHEHWQGVRLKQETIIKGIKEKLEALESGTEMTLEEEQELDVQLLKLSSKGSQAFRELRIRWTEFQFEKLSALSDMIEQGRQTPFSASEGEQYLEGQMDARFAMLFPQKKKEFMDIPDQETRSLCVDIIQMLEDIVNKREYHDGEHVKAMIGKLRHLDRQKEVHGQQVDGCHYNFLLDAWQLVQPGQESVIKDMERRLEALRCGQAMLFGDEQNIFIQLSKLSRGYFSERFRRLKTRWDITQLRKLESLLDDIELKRQASLPTREEVLGLEKEIDARFAMLFYRHGPVWDDLNERWSVIQVEMAIQARGAGVNDEEIHNCLRLLYRRRFYKYQELTDDWTATKVERACTDWKTDKNKADIKTVHQINSYLGSLKGHPRYQELRLSWNEVYLDQILTTLENEKQPLRYDEEQSIHGLLHILDEAGSRQHKELCSRFNAIKLDSMLTHLEVSKRAPTRQERESIRGRFKQIISSAAHEELRIRWSVIQLELELTGLETNNRALHYWEVRRITGLIQILQSRPELHTKMNIRWSALRLDIILTALEANIRRPGQEELREIRTLLRNLSVDPVHCEPRLARWIALEKKIGL